jgi:D-alanyl-lipoteichoic acid acyltransferase DltB (MBOAT superfamily)
VIADGMVRFVDPAFGVLSGGGLVPRHVALGAILAYYAQLYFDFSGYSDAALGLARLFGLRLPLNFDSPLRATGIVDFYRRWHMTLTRVISRFLYTPLAMVGARWALDHRLGPWLSKVVSLWLPLMINFQIIALWHGATATFVLFGIVHGIWYVTETEIRATKTWRAWRKRTSEKRRRILGQVFTFAPLALTFALFRSDSPAAFHRLVTSLFFGSGGTNENLGYRGAFIEIIAAFAVIWFLPNLNELMRRYRPAIATFVNLSTTPLWARFVWRPTAIWGLFGAAIVAVVITRLNKPTPFLYGGF